MDSQTHDARDPAGPPPLSPLLPRTSEVFERLVGNGDTSLDLTQLNQIAELSYERSCPEIVLALTQCAERSPASRLRLAKTLTVLGHLLVAGSEELLTAVNAVFESFRVRVDCILAGNAPDHTAETMSFIQERADAITELLGDQSLLSQTRRGTALVLPHVLRRKDPRAGFAIGMTADSEAPVLDTSPSGFLKYRREFASMDITDQVSYQDIASVTSSHLSEIHHGWWSKEGDLEGRVKVALKVVVRYPEIARGKEVKRYADEMLIWRKLHHDNILPLYGVCWLGKNGAPALVSPWCDHGDVNQYIRSCKREHRDIDGLKLEMFYHVLQGLEYLHENRIIHGDVKGANVLVSAQGVARLCDFGLASALDNSGSLSSSSKTPGTRRWMAPELLKGTRTIHADIWAFGCLVLEVQSEDKPFYKFDSEYLVMTALGKNQTPHRPSRFPDRLWWLALRTWQIAYAARPTAAALSSQVTTLRNVYANGPAAWTWTAVPQSEDLPYAVIERLLGEDLGHQKKLDYLLKATPLQAMYLLFATVEGKGRLDANFKRVPDYATTVSRLCIEGAHNVRRDNLRLFGLLAKAALDYLKHRCQSEQRETPWADPGKRLVSASFRSAMAAYPRPASELGALLQLLEPARGKSGRATLAWVKENFPSALKVAASSGHAAAVECLSYSADGDRIISGSQDKTLRFWDARTGAALKTLKGHVAGITCLAACASRVTSGGSDGTVRVWDAADGGDIAGSLTVEDKSMVTCVSISPDGQRVASSSRDRTVHLRDAASGRLLCSWYPSEHVEEVRHLAFSNDSAYLAVFSITSGGYILFRLGIALDTFLQLADSPAHAVPWESPVPSSALSCDLTQVAFGRRDGDVTVVDIQSGSIVATDRHGFDVFRHAPVEAVAFSPCGSIVASSSKGTMRVYDVATKHFVQPDIQLAVGEPDQITPTHAIAFAPDGKTVATGSDDGCVRIWDVTGTWKFFPKQASAASKRKSQLVA